MTPRRNEVNALICFKAIRAAMLSLALLMSSTGTASAVVFLRDAGMEHAVAIIARPILTAAGLPARSTRILVIQDMSLNAFVIDSRHIFIHAGLFLRLKSAAELQAIIAHEAAHIANGHFSRRRLNAQSARTLTGLSTALALAAGAAVGNPVAGLGAAAGAAGSLQRNFLAHTRAEEAAADQSGLRYMAAAGVDPRAMLGVLELFAGKESVTIGRLNPYAVSHPLTADRMRSVINLASALKGDYTRDESAEYWFQRARGKLSAYLRSPAYTFNRLSPSDTSDAAMIERAVAHFREPNMAAAREAVATLIERRPDDPFIFDLAGWIEIDSGQAGPAVEAYARAVELAPRNALILAGYGRALMALDTPESRSQALDVLQQARARDRYNSRLLRDLGRAYAANGQPGMASLHTAERYALLGSPSDARLHAQRAVGQLPTGSPGWSRAQDLIRETENAKRRR